MCVCSCEYICADFGKRSFLFARFFVGCSKRKEKTAQYCIDLLSHHKHHIIKQNMHYYQLEFNFNSREFDCGRENYAVLCINTHAQISVAYHKLFALHSAITTSLANTVHTVHTVKLELQLVITFKYIDTISETLMSIFA